MKAKSIQGNSTIEIKTALKQSIATGFKPTVAIFFISIKQDRKAIVELFQKENIEVFGATSCGEFTDAIQSEGGIAILLIDVAPDLFSIIFEETGNRSVADTAKALSEKAKIKFENPSLILCSTGLTSQGELFDGNTLVQTVKESLGNDKIFFGGMAGDDMTFTGSYIFTTYNETDSGIAAIVFNADKLNMFGMAITGWQPMGISRIVTKSIGNKLFAIDDKPAVEMYLKYLGKEEKRTDREFKVFEELGFTYPFITEREPGGEMMLKTPLKINHEENALVMDMEMPEGTKFWFTMPPDFDIVDEIIDEANQIKNIRQPEADALLIFSCAGRQPVLGPLVTAENNGLADIWKTPMAGFFTYGEYGRTKNGKQEFHSGACCWVALKEK